MNGFYFDEREQREKPVPSCSAAHPDLEWNPKTQRCEIRGMRVRPYRRYRNQQGLGFLDPGGGGGDGGGDLIAAAIAGIGAAIGAIFGGFGGAQRGADERTSGEYLTSADQAKNVILLEYQRGNLTKAQARELFESQVINTFKQRISTLKTESVRDSRSNNQVNDLRNLFENDLATLPLLFAPSDDGGDGGGSGIDFGDIAVDIFGNPIFGGGGGTSEPGTFNPPTNTSEVYGNDGSYYYEDSQTGEWFYDDGQGNSYGGSGQGDVYGMEGGDYYEVDTSGNYYYEAGSGEWYYEDAAGQWSSGDSTGYGCSGDAGGNWSCSDGSRGGPDTLSAKDRQNRQRAPQKRSTPIQKKATGAQKAIQLAQQGAKVLQQARAQAQGSAAQAKRQASAQAINSAGARNPAVRAITGANANANGGSGFSNNTLLLLGIGAVAVIALSRK